MTEDETLGGNADVLRGIEDVPPSGDIPLPERQLFPLERARREALGAASPVPKIPDVRSKAIRLVFVRRLLQVAAALILIASLTLPFLPKRSSTNPLSQPVQVAKVVITSPGDFIATTRPRIAWTSKDAPGQRYDVWILPAEGDYLSAPPLFAAKSVTSPIDFAALKGGDGITNTGLVPGTDYRVLVCLADAGRMAGVPVPFKTLPAAK